MRFEQWQVAAMLVLSLIMTTAAAATAAADPLRRVTGVSAVESRAAAAFVIATADGKASISIDTAAAPDLREWART